MPDSNPIFIPFSKLNGDKKCITCSLQNFTGKVHITLDGVLFCSTDYDGFEENLEQAFDSFGLGVGVPPVGVVAIGIINDDEAAAAAAAADGFDGNEELVVGETLNGGHGGHGDDKLMRRNIDIYTLNKGKKFRLYLVIWGKFYRVAHDWKAYFKSPGRGA
ncbi:hypothetical protein FRACYDRAFT_233758 [Fragilariopsis cylindrus CCMP1102]|uniref:Uncharacterized protein n=1 Tax=Fragilariopsis cylindrus CCMP1102 TaxID=635003 RepID=A0A1E7G065_9STRA|nr:hypothetical protein FRACYDRAFT_233758 [Fragilariopsis cylindrus CCMP1102]|eukprot:OEU23583.1 hypothetical protein FRACYDRAFT_233758 [Fragilariopsis cylindrus CCMP1102]